MCRSMVDIQSPTAEIRRRKKEEEEEERRNKPQGKTRWLYCVECPQYSTRLEALGYLCHRLSGRVQR